MEVGKTYNICSRIENQRDVFIGTLIREDIISGSFDGNYIKKEDAQYMFLVEHNTYRFLKKSNIEDYIKINNYNLLYLYLKYKIIDFINIKTIEYNKRKKYKQNIKEFKNKMKEENCGTKTCEFINAYKYTNNYIS